MTQEELDKILKIHAIAGSTFFSILEDIDMPEDCKAKVDLLFTMTNSLALKELKNNFASELDFPEKVNQIIEELDGLEEEIQKD